MVELLHRAHALTSFDALIPAVASVMHFLDVRVAKYSEGLAWAITSSTTPSVEDQLEQLKASLPQFGGSAKELVLPALLEYVRSGDMTKKTAVQICQCLLLILQNDYTSAPQATKAYLTCLTSPKVGIREAATFFLLDFLVYCSPAQHYTMLAHLFMEDSDVAKSSISLYFKSDLFKAEHS
ncbi:hypothetical protein DYB32_000103 [Aphanomyces invadans]|uniref:Clathrin/coatomer adaptor adaptin-like N-terminal domain-containing protein n=1 Tax=Aphanomyces invadans TaxID=157072 RepID=A0A3R6VIS4_9STRA|nr:hypothetical protein DYB32_000103 [Aphanomyces invadans]